MGIVFFTVVLGMTNLILAVIVDKALQAHDDDLKRQATDKRKEEDKAMDKFMDMCEEMDVDEDGMLSLQELRQGFRHVPQFRAMLDIMDIDEHELEVLFYIMDRDGSGEVSYAEFGEELSKVKNASVTTTLSFTKFHVVQTRVMMEQMVTALLPPDMCEKLFSQVGHMRVNALIESTQSMMTAGEEEFCRHASKNYFEGLNVSVRDDKEESDSEIASGFGSEADSGSSKDTGQEPVGKVSKKASFEGQEPRSKVPSFAGSTPQLSKAVSFGEDKWMGLVASSASAIKENGNGTFSEQLSRGNSGMNSSWLYTRSLGEQLHILTKQAEEILNQAQATAQSARKSAVQALALQASTANIARSNATASLQAVPADPYHVTTLDDLNLLFPSDLAGDSYLSNVSQLVEGGFSGVAAKKRKGFRETDD